MDSLHLPAQEVTVETGDGLASPHQAPTVPSKPAPVAATQADGWLVVSRKMDMSRPLPPYRYTYSYTLETRLDDADQLARDTMDDEYPGWELVGIVACKEGVPIGTCVMP
jgi:hypothetical protein